MELTGHGGTLAVAVLRAHGVREMFTLSGGHVFPLYDGAVTAEPPLPLYDVRHEQSAVFAAEAVAKLARRPGLAVLTAGPGITNGISAVTTAHFNGSPVLVLGGRAPTGLWGAGSLQELDHPPLLAPVTKLASTATSTADIPVIGDGGDFVSFAGRLIESRTPGCWLDPGPYGCLGTGLGYALGARVARPDAQIVLLLGDGAAGFSLMDVDSLVRHQLPVVIVVGNNGIWGLEKHPMQALYGYDVVADLAPGCRYDEVVRALGGAGELVASPEAIGPALDRAFASGVPYLVNVLTDPAVAYPRSTML